MTALKNWLNPAYLTEKKQQQIKEQFAKNKPFPYYIFEDFLLPDKAMEIRKALMTLPFEEKDADLFFFAQTEDLLRTQESLIRGFINFLQSEELQALIATITGKKLAPTIDAFGAVYPPTGYLLPHDDQLEGRSIAYVYNLSQGFKKSNGGALELFSTKEHKPQEVVKSYPPKWNAFVIFEVSPDSFHQVSEVHTNNPRLSITGWFHGER
ncbi:MAG TPA: 2OG-Fe(II) oxygenase family protein [Candidatus Nanoarchaeia archaeon]|nr:2OG-Fe(II) oxygenase family protein [Candidatus Nanoarchaeia archaeon]